MMLKTVRTLSAKRITALSVLAVALGVSGCTMTSSAPTAFMQDCLSDRLDIVENATWDGVQPRRIRIIDGNYRPMVMYFEKDRPYILTVENVDASAHDLWAPGLLKQGVALHSVQIGDKAPAKGCVNGVRIAPRSQVTLKFVPVYEGRYEFYDGGFPLLAGNMADGVFHVVAPRAGVASK
ncbi:MAG: hypothetical protein JKY27_05145 [Magnetovibrio sp.]|nr:hypothetical protein [Magnetovibrio sp.]